MQKRQGLAHHTFGLPYPRMSKASRLFLNSIRTPRGGNRCLRSWDAQDEEKEADDKGWGDDWEEEKNTGRQPSQNDGNPETGKKHATAHSVRVGVR